MKIGAEATRIPASELLISSSPSAIRMNGAATCATETARIIGQRPARPANARARSASGTRTSAPSAIRPKAIIGGERSLPPILISR